METINTLISPENTWAIWAVILAITFLAIFLESKYKWAQQISAAVIGLVVAVILTNLNIMPMESPVYDVVWAYVIPLSIPMLLFRSNLARILRESGPMLLLFVFGCLGTIGSVVLGYVLLNNQIDYLGQIAGMMTGSYIGGGVNFVALADVFQIPSEMVSATTVADNFNMAIYFVVLIAVTKIGFFRKNWKTPYIDEIEEHGELQNTKEEQAKEPMTSGELAQILATSAVIVAISTSLASWFASAIPADTAIMSLINQLLGNEYLIITTITMVLATAFPSYFETMNYADEVGNFLISIFFVVIGFPASIQVILTTAPLLFIFCAIMVLVNMFFVFLGAKIFNYSLEESIITSNACIGGPATASAMAISQGWKNLIAPGIFVGLLGYIVGNWAGTLVGNFLI